MRRLLSNGLVVFAGMVSLPSSVTHYHLSVAGTPPAETRFDPRLDSLKKFFEERGCPALAVAEVFLQAADAYGLDWRLLPSISFVESTGGKQLKNNNLFGWDSGRAQFASLSSAIHAVAFALANSSLYKDKDLDTVLETYNPDAEYAQKVKSVMQRISPSE